MDERGDQQLDLSAELNKAHCRIRDLERQLSERVLVGTSDEEGIDTERYKGLVEIQSEFITLFNPDFTLTFANKALCDLVNLPRNKLLEHKILDFMDLDNQQEFKECVSRISMDNPLERHEENLLLPNGEECYMSWINQGVFNSAGEIIEYQAVGRDITDLKLIQTELKKAKDAAEDADNAKSRFLAMMSHELKTPMNGIMTSLQLLKDRRDNFLPADQQLFEIIDNSSHVLLRLLEDILEFTKITTGGIILENSVFELDKLVFRVVDLLDSQAKEKNLRLFTSIDSDVSNIIYGDPGHLRQILTNIVGNAIKFTKAGEIRIAVTAIEKNDNSIQLKFSINDTGTGVPSNEFSKIFTPFYQVGPFMTREFGGAGLGLAMCKKLINFMGGEIGLNSEIGIGSEFWFKLPFVLPCANDKI